jgi:hypothetical protein
MIFFLKGVQNSKSKKIKIQKKSNLNLNLKLKIEKDFFFFLKKSENFENFKPILLLIFF